jgi:peroxiredoxin
MSRLLLILSFLATTAAAQPGGLAVGSPIPESGLALRDVAGRTVTLGGSVGSAGLVVAFWSNTCPWAERNADRLAALAREYGPAGVAFVAVSADPGDQAAKQRVAGALGIPYVDDAGGALMRAFGVRSLPTVVYFSANSRLVYEGAIDDSPADANSVDVPYLRQAMDQTLAGIPVSVQRTAALGCAVR